ncbi:TPA: hypothetical protein N0F65_001753 [Lagenidium giganteum]|uniref:Uncharacterized protein n=1 Tax=Lagenidium giganteum TaxID=4803 RepID=A0AAV2Z5N5_9STRA|nr:TPA: hypothetical protein N0F65_001753 [Lagenidium giganteum]
MTSIAASPAYTESLKKRGRLIGSDAFELGRKKRCRVVELGNEAAEEEDVPKYTQRHVDYFEQVKQADIARIRTEYEQYIMKKDVEFQNMRQEMQQLVQRLHAQEKDSERLQGENKILKRAVAIQNQRKEECLQENAVLKQLTSQAAEHIKRLEQSNYALRVHLQTSNTVTRGDCSQPPDVF